MQYIPPNIFKLVMNRATVWILSGLLLLVSCGQSPPPTNDVQQPPEKADGTVVTDVLEIPLATPIREAFPSPADMFASARHRQTGLDLRSQGQLAEAIAMFQQGVSLDPTNLNGHVILGWTLHLAGQRQEAIAALQAGLERDADFVPALNALGIVYLVDGQLQSAVKTHQRAAELQSDNEIAYYNLSLAYQRLEQPHLAEVNAKQATELEPWNPHPWVALAIALRSQDRLEDARGAYARAIQLDSRYTGSAYLNHLSQAGFSPAQIELSDRVRQGL